MKQKLFVYGTLRKGESRHHHLAQARCVSQLASMHGLLVDTSKGYPAVIPDAQHHVAGELYEIDEATLATIDRVEGYVGPGHTKNHYERVKCDVHTDRGTHIAWTYVSTKFSSQSVIAHGDWKLYKMLKHTSVPYFAYGSCMDTGRFEDHGVAHNFTDVMGRGICEGFNLQFTRRGADGSGKADIVEKGGTVEGKLYRLTPQTIVDYLYGREGYSADRGVLRSAYRPTIVRVKQTNGQVIDALTFVVVNKESSSIRPSQEYMTQILSGAQPIVSETYYADLKRRFEEEFGYTSLQKEWM